MRTFKYQILSIKTGTGYSSARKTLFTVNRINCLSITQIPGGLLAYIIQSERLDNKETYTRTYFTRESRNSC